MLIEVLAATLFGVIAGMFTGLTPGLHTNTLAIALVTALPFLPVEPLIGVVALLSMSIAHTIISAIPSILLGAPDPSLAVAALPGHRMYLEGRGLEAVSLTVIGSICALLWCATIAYFLFKFMPIIFEMMRPHILWFLLAAIGFLLYREQRTLLCFGVIALSGFYGWSVFHVEQVTNPLFHMLSGLFGVSLLWCSFAEDKSAKPTTQKRFKLPLPLALSGVGALAGCCAAFFPGLGSSQMAILAQSLFKKIGDEGFLMLTGGINTANMFLSMITLYAIDKARNGSVVALKSIITIDGSTLVLLLGVMLVGAGIASVVTVPLSKLIGVLLRLVGENAAASVIIMALIAFAFRLDGWLGLLVILTGMLMGIVAQQLSIPKHYLMGCLLVPVLFYLW